MGCHSLDFSFLFHLKWKLNNSEHDKRKMFKVKNKLAKSKILLEEYWIMWWQGSSAECKGLKTEEKQIKTTIFTNNVHMSQLANYISLSSFFFLYGECVSVCIIVSQYCIIMCGWEEKQRTSLDKSHGYLNRKCLKFIYKNYLSTKLIEKYISIMN